MADETKIEIADIAKAPVKAAEAAIEVVTSTVKDGAKAIVETVKPAAKPAQRRAAKRAAVAPKAAKRRIAARKINRATRKTARVAKEGIETMTKTNTNFFNAFETLPTFAPFQSMIDQANERSQDMVKKGQKVAEELADLTRANVEAIVEAGRVAAEGARSIGQDLVAKGRDGVDQASDAIRGLAEAKSPTEYLQLQGEFARAQFDRMVQDSSKLTETMVKLAGEAFQPLQNRAAANAQRFNTLVA